MWNEMGLKREFGGGLEEREFGGRLGGREVKGVRESDRVWWVYEKSDTCHLISGALVVLDVLHWR